MNRKGFTLIEGLATMTILAIVALYAYQLHAPIVTFFQRSISHQQTNANIRISLDTLTHALEEARASSIRISNGTGAPNSKIDFILDAPLLSGTTAYSFFLSNGQLEMYEYNPNLIDRTTLIPQKLADGVSALMFANDTTDASIVYLTLRIDSQVSTTGRTNPTVQVTNQPIHAVINP